MRQSFRTTPDTPQAQSHLAVHMNQYYVPCRQSFRSMWATITEKTKHAAHMEWNHQPTWTGNRNLRLKLSL